MMDTVDQLYSWIWQDHFWLPGNVTFKDLDDKDGMAHPHSQDLLIIPLLSIGIFFIRMFYERFMAQPFAKRHIPSKVMNRIAPIKNATLEDYFKVNPNPKQKEIDGLSKRMDWSTSAIDKWFRRRRNMDRPNLGTKFCEASWRFLFYTGIFTYGMCVLWKSPWFWDHALCWEDYANQNLDFEVYIYYVAELSFYFSLLLSISGDVKRKDFTEQVIHHLSTILLISFSYVVNFVRVGTLVMAVHDISDIFLELAKCFHYLKLKKLSETAFTVFAIVFIISRLVLFPFWVIHTTLVKSRPAFQANLAYFFFNGLLLILQCLHIFWTCTILKMVVTMLGTGLQKDERSDAEESTDQEGKD